MRKYRLIEDKKNDANGKVQFVYYIQHKFIFWWVHAPIKVHYFTCYNKAYLMNRYYTFDDKELAMLLFNLLKNPFKIVYFNNVIKKIYSEYSRDFVYINISSMSSSKLGIEYDFSYSLEDLKKQINQTVIKSEKNILS